MAKQRKFVQNDNAITKTAYWTRRTQLFRADEFVCSACEAVFGKPYRVCPACKAPMKKTKYDPSWADEADDLSALLDDDW